MPRLLLERCGIGQRGKNALIYHGLFPEDDSLLPGGWTQEQANSVRSFLETYNSLPTENEKILFAIGTGNISILMRHLGRPIWNKFATKGLNDWGIHNAIVQEFERHDCHPMAILKHGNILDSQASIQKIWPVSTHHVPTIVDTLSQSLFGDDAFIPGTEALTSTMHLEKKSPTKASITRVIRALATWKDSEVIFGTRDCLKEADEMLAQLLHCLYWLIWVGLNIPLYAAPRRILDKLLQGLATEANVAEIMNVYVDYFELNADDDEPVAKPAPAQKCLNDVFDDGDDFGVECEMISSPEVLSRELGFVKGIPPAFHDQRHPLGLNPWDNREAFLAKIQLLPMRLHWHQLAGVHSIVRKLWSVKSTLQGAGVLVGDEVGLGKTAQAIALLAFFNLVINAKLTNKPMPPILGEYITILCYAKLSGSPTADRPYLHDNDTIEPRPFIILCPGTLVPQWANEIKTLLRPFSFDIYVYDGSLSGENFWAPGWTVPPFKACSPSSYHRGQTRRKSSTPICSRSLSLFLKTFKALFKEFNANFGPFKKGKRPWEIPRLTKHAVLGNTLMGHRYLVTIVDEAHVVRHAGRQHSAILKVLEGSVVRIPMTATPLHTASKVS
ncbi:hypothetical protein C0993_009749 [Termitomyces sp. T159_Od127]|nr:hypothetical protein C0993_009749 [Termitomyces sp. T159_Od127]